MKAKKILAFAMAVVLSLAVAAPAMATGTDYTSTPATLTSNDDTSSYSVYANAEVGTVAYTTAINVTVAWSGTTGQYTVGSTTYEWDATNKKYTQGSANVVQTTAPAMTITLTNNSDVYEDYKVEYTAATAYAAIVESGDNKTGTLASYTAVNATVPQSSTARASGTYAMDTKNTATYTGSFSIAAGKTLTMNNGTVVIGNYKVTLSKPANSSLTYAVSSTSTISVSTLLASTTVEYNPATGKTAYAYNGFISSTTGATWYDAMAFVQMLNENGVVPSNETIKGTNGGYWRLLSSEADAKAWATATTGEESGFGNVLYLWSSAEFEDDTDLAYGWGCARGTWYDYGKTDSDSDFGFVVVWAQN